LHNGGALRQKLSPFLLTAIFPTFTRDGNCDRMDPINRRRPINIDINVKTFVGAAWFTSVGLMGANVRHSVETTQRNALWYRIFYQYLAIQMH
jgi:hypothetical protein